MGRGRRWAQWMLRVLRCWEQSGQGLKEGSVEDWSCELRCRPGLADLSLPAPHTPKDGTKWLPFFHAIEPCLDPVLAQHQRGSAGARTQQPGVRCDTRLRPGHRYGATHRPGRRSCLQAGRAPGAAARLRQGL